MLKKYFANKYFTVLLLLFSSQSFAIEIENFDVEINNNGESIITSERGIKTYCKINGIDIFNSEKDFVLTTARLSYDKKTLILTDNSYVFIDDFLACQGKITARHSSLFLRDVNKKKGLLLTIDSITTNPANYLATISKMDGTDLIIKNNSFYKKGVSLRKQGKFAFIDAREGVISMNGEYVSPSGDPDCSEGAYPGVIEIKTGKRIIIKKSNEISDQEINTRCMELFE
ncbi:hypothetical protein [Iodobacter sp.]|uniref:hypothetical protein n=1 Tax=Iodobacter sp. TaxID=1915058 RepID=UPI0025E10C6D|nr:hypothetical protein [Iodobacter sp.]